MLDLAKKELVERAARPSTYWARVVNWALLLGVLLIVEGTRSNRNFGMLTGEGAQLFFLLAWVQWAAILLCVPLAMAGAIATERERGTWELLQLTDLRPWEIIVQKFVAGLIPMITSIILLAPIGAMAMSVGGLETSSIWLAILSLVCATFLIGAISLLCSTLILNGTAATLVAYIISVAFLFVPNLSPASGLILLRAGGQSLHMPLAVQLIISLALLVIANYGLLRSRLALDTPFVCSLRRNVQRDSQTSGRDQRESSILVQAPVAWRELKRLSLDRWYYLLGYASPFVLLISGIAWATESLPNWQARVVMPRLNFALWIASFLVLALVSANIVLRERNHQTLAILLTSPIKSCSLMRQKARALRHLALVCGIVLASSALASVVVRTDLNPWTYLVSVTLGAFFYLPAVYWLGLIIGARSTNWRRAASTVVVVLASIVGIPFLADYLPVFYPLIPFSPTAYIARNEFGFATTVISTLELLFHFGLMALIILGLRHVAIWFATTWLGRTTGSAWINTEQEPITREYEDPY